MSTLEENFTKAKIYIQNGSSQHLKQAKDLLRQIQNEYVGTSYATQASDLLNKLNKDSVDEPPSKVAVNLRNKWASISLVRDSRLQPFLQALFHLDLRHEVAVTNLRHEAINKLSGWIKDVDNEIWLNGLVQPVLEHPDFEHQLDEVLDSWWKKRFNDQYNTIESKVADALTMWAVDEARDRLAPLLNPSLPSHLRNKVSELEHEISGVEQDKVRLIKLLGEFSDSVAIDWKMLKVLIIHRQDLQPFQVTSHYALPDSWQDKIDEKLGAFSTLLKKIIENQSLACIHLADVRQFYAEFNALGFEEFEESDFFKISWFEEVQKKYEQENNNELKNAASINELAQIHQRLWDDTKSLPSMLVEWLQKCVDAVDTLINQWRQLIMGVEFIDEFQYLKSFENLQLKSLVATPDAFQRDIEEYQSLWQQLSEIEAQLDTKNTLMEKDFQAAREYLEQILAKYPEHQRAKNLLAIVKNQKQTYFLVQFLQQWKIDTFLQQCRIITTQTESAEPSEPTDFVRPYLHLAAYETPLLRLKQLYESYESNTSNKCSTAQAAATWWEDWHEAIAQLPNSGEQLGEFSEQLEKIALAHRRAWFQMLDKLLDNSKTKASDCREAMKYLESWQGWSAHFLKYYNALNRFAWHQEALEYMERAIELNKNQPTGKTWNPFRSPQTKEWKGAQNAIEKFEQAGGDKTKLERLKLFLALRKAEAENLSKLVEVLLEQWFLIKAYLSDELGKLLFKAIRYTWQKNEKARLTQLKDLASSIPEVDRSKLLELSLKWLTIEEALQAVTPSILLEFVKLVFVKNGRGIRYLLREPVKQLVEQWQKDNYLLFAWFYIACQQVKPPLIHGAVDPLNQLIEQSQQTAAHIKKHLAQLTEISDTDLADAQLKSELDDWQQLKNFINLLPFTPADQPEVPDSLKEVNEWLNRLKQTKQDLMVLEDADLRKDEHRTKLLTTQHFIREQLSGFLVRDTWLNRVDVLEPFTRLHFILSQFGKATRRFGSDDPTDLAQRDLLVTMRNYLLELIKKFEDADVVERGFWQILSKECFALVCQEGGVLKPAMPDEPDLQALCDLLPILDDEEKRFRIALIKLYDEARLTRIPSGAQIDVSREQYHTFFRAIPLEPPRTRRSYWLFKKEADKEPMATLFKQAQGLSHLPAWVSHFLDLEH